jgi:chaperonin GroEL
MDKRYQVFVSSTYADLVEERRHVIQTLLRMDCIPAGMELFPAMDEEQFHFIRRVIDDCDYYILIIGGRYGSVTAEGVSFTEKEYDYAVQRGLRVLAYVHSAPDNIPVAKSDIAPELRSRLTSFREKVKSGRLVSLWTDAKELPGLVAVGLTKTIKAYPAVGWVRASQLVSAELSVDKPQELLLRGMAQVEKLVSRAFGPRGTNVSVTLSSHQVVSNRQGSIIAQGIHSSNPIEENGIEQMRNVGRSISAAVGDGTKTAMLLAHAFVKGGQSALSAGCEVKELLKGMESAVKAARSSIIAHSRAAAPDSLMKIAKAASGDQEISRLVLQASERAGNDGVTVIDTTSGPNTELHVQGGLWFDRGYLSSRFVTNAATDECELSDCWVLVHDQRISNMKDLLPILEEVARSGRPILIIADDVESEALSTLLVNNLRGTLRSAAVKAPGTGDHRRALLQDIAILTGAKVLAADLGFRIDQAHLKDLGHAEKIVLTKAETRIFGGSGHPGDVAAQISRLRTAIDRANNAPDRERLQQRLASLGGNIATIKIGGATEVDIEERRYAAVSAMFSVRAAIEMGCSYGGGISFLNAKAAVAALIHESESERTGAAVIHEALDVPFFALASTCHRNGVSLLAERQRLADTAVGFNVETGNLENFSTLGILDPTRSVCSAIEIALSYSRTILKTDTWSVSTLQPDGWNI